MSRNLLFGSSGLASVASFWVVWPTGQHETAAPHKRVHFKRLGFHDCE